MNVQETNFLIADDRGHALLANRGPSFQERTATEAAVAAAEADDVDQKARPRLRLDRDDLCHASDQGRLPGATRQREPFS